MWHIFVKFVFATKTCLHYLMHYTKDLKLLIFSLINDINLPQRYQREERNPYGLHQAFSRNSGMQQIVEEKL